MTSKYNNSIYEKDDEASKEDNAKTQDDANKKESKIVKFITDAFNNYAADKAGDLLDELFLGNFKDAVIDIYKSQKASKMSEEDLSKAMSDLKELPAYKRGKDYAELDNRKDDNTSTDVDETTVKMWAMWKSKDKEADIGKTMNQIVADFQKSAQETENQKKELASKLKQMKIKITDEEFNQFGPMLQKVVEEGDAKAVQKKVDELKSQLKESFDIHARMFKSTKLLTEGTSLLTEDEKQCIFLDVLLESKEYQDAIYEMMLNEGWLGDKIKGVGKAIGSKLKDVGGKTVQFLTKSAIMPMLSLGSLSASIFTGGWAAAGILKLMYFIEKQGKKLRNGFERAYTRYANSKGTIAEMDFAIQDKKDLKYAMRFYEKDMVWRVLNTSDQLKHPGKDFAKSILDGNEGKRFRDVLRKTWDPLFSEAKGGKIDFKALLSQAKNVDIPEKYIELYQRFADNYDQIKSNCIESPKIDTRTQSLKND